MAAGCSITEEDRQPIAVEVGTIGHQFQYLGAIISNNGQIDVEIDRRIANTSKAFGALCQAVFKDHNLLPTQRSRFIRHVCFCLIIWSRVL